MKKLLSILILLVLLPVACPAQTVPQSVEQKIVPVYCSLGWAFEPAADLLLLPEFPIYYLDGVGDLPYADLTEFVRLLNCLEASGGEEAEEFYAAEADDASGVFTCTWLPQDSSVIIDFSRGTLTYTCMDTFGRDPAFSPFEVQTDRLNFLQRTVNPSWDRLGGERTISLADYGIMPVFRDGRYLIPLHTAFDFLFWVSKAPFRILCCNGEALFIGETDSMFGYSDALSELGEIYFAKQPTQRSPQLAEYGYNELCLMLDCFYGLKDAHHIDSFRGFFRANGYEEALLSPDPNEADQALQEIIRYALDDLHSIYSFPSWMSGIDAEPQARERGYSEVLRDNAGALFEAAARKAFPDGMSYYSEYGNTAYVIISSLTTRADSETYYSLDLDDPDAGEFLDLTARILYAHRQITRENSPIENVVLDLSLCPGGDFNSAAFVLSWALGDGTITTANTFTGGLGINRYRADLDRDHQFTDADSLIGKTRLFCLISPLTFSSGNLTAAMLKASGAVTLLGQTTLGGSGMRTPAVTGWDSIFVLSGFRQIVTVKNGSWYDADPGVTPHVYLSDPESFYNREELTEFINGLR